MKFNVLYLVTVLVLLALLGALYVHLFDPFTARFIKDNGVEMVRVDTPLQDPYIEECLQVLTITYVISAVAFITCILCVWRKIKLGYVIVPLLVLLIALQIADYLQSRRLWDTFYVVNMGV